MKPLLLALFFLYGTWGIFSVYGTLYFQNIMGATPLQVVAWYVPLGVAGLLLSVLEGFILHMGTWPYHSHSLGARRIRLATTSRSDSDV